MTTLNASQHPGGNSQEDNTSSRTNEGKPDQQKDTDNPQQGSAWNNYQTRETSSSEKGLSAEEAAQVFENDES